MTPENLKYGPKCIICGRKDKIDIFDSSAWLQIDIKQPYNEHGDTLIWICPTDIEKLQVVIVMKKKIKELEKEIHELNMNAQVVGEAYQKDVNRLEKEIQKYHGFFKTLNEFLEETKDI